MNDSYVELHVPDFQIAKDFYGKLGFKVAREQKSEEKKKNYLVMQRGKTILCFYPGNDVVWEQSYFKNFPKDTKRGFGVELVISADDIDKLYQTAKQFAKIVGELKVKHWGKKDFRLEDPFGFYIRFTEPYDILSPNEAL